MFRGLTFSEMLAQEVLYRDQEKTEGQGPYDYYDEERGALSVYTRLSSLVLFKG
jgi:hypothetical protein